jgi:hypothetical protein
MYGGFSIDSTKTTITTMAAAAAGHGSLVLHRRPVIPIRRVGSTVATAVAVVAVAAVVATATKTSAAIAAREYDALSTR